jgi:uncharacterized membrane protein YiaA
MNENEDRRRFHIFAMIRIVGLLTFLAGVFIATTDLLEPGGSPLIGGILAMVGAIDAVLAPKVLKMVMDKK